MAHPGKSGGGFNPASALPLAVLPSDRRRLLKKKLHEEKQGISVQVLPQHAEVNQIFACQLQLDALIPDASTTNRGIDP